MSHAKEGNSPFINERLVLLAMKGDSHTNSQTVYKHGRNIRVLSEQKNKTIK